MDETKGSPLSEDELRTIEQQAESGFRPHEDAVLRLVAEVRRCRDGASPFTWEDVDVLRDTATGYESGDWGFGYKREAQQCEALADRIAALLPPREP